MEDNTENSLDNLQPIEEAPHHNWYNERLKICAEHILKGYTPSQVHDIFGEAWGVSLKSVINYFTNVRKIMREQIIDNENDLKIDLLCKYSFIYQHFIRNENYVEAKKVLDSVAKIALTQRHDITSNGQAIETIRLIEVKKEE